MQEPIPTPGEGQILIRNIYLSLDPTNRGWLDEKGNNFPPVDIGAVMRGFCIGVVEQSCNDNFPKGTYVQGLLGWQDYAISDGTDLDKLTKDPSTPLTAYLGLFGFIGITAYFGLLEIGKPKAGETLVVSAAAGAVGSIVGQIGKIKGCRVIGIAGSAEKCRWLKDELGFDAAIDYKTESVLESLQQHCPNGIDVFWRGMASHVHTPTGGQGMNTGIQNAYNLAWKIALVLKGAAGDVLIESYNEEQLANAKRLLQTIDRAFEILVGDYLLRARLRQRWYLRFFRTNILPSLAGVVMQSSLAKEFLFPTVSQIGLNTSQLSYLADLLNVRKL